MLTVQKFGGSSLADAEGLCRAAALCIRERQRGRDVAMVVSAMGDTTDELLAMAYSVSSAPSPRELDALLGTGENYTMLGAVTHGNLYLIAKEGEYTEENLSSLIGKTVGVLQINEVPGLTLKSVLNKYDIPWQELTNGGEKAEDKVNLVAITGADAVGVIEADCFMIAEPAASAQGKKGYSIVGDLQALYGGENGYPQAVLVAKKALVAEKTEWIKEFVSKVEGASLWLQTASGEDIVAAVSAHMEDKDTATSLKAPLLSSAVLGRCGVYFTYASACSMEVEVFLNGMLAVNDKAAAIPAQAFYWEYVK